MSAIKRIGYRNSEKTSGFEIVDFSLFLSTRPKELITKDYRVNFWLMIYIIEGSGTHYVDFEPYAYKAGDIILVQRHQVHHFDIPEKVVGYVLNIDEPFIYSQKGIFSESFFDLFDRSFQGPLISINTGINATNRKLMDMLYQEYHVSENAYDKLLIQSLFSSFIRAVLSQIKEDYGLRSKAAFKTYDHYRKLVDEHFDKIKTVEAYAHMMGLSKKTLNNAARDIVGLTAKQIIINRIVIEIKRYLSQGELLIYEISDLLGFDEAANMTKFFKHYTGQSPKSFQSKDQG
ncbi:MAG: helix-turn-helix domain-containing protein [Clostridia bacterium]|nr:helix-turn-helix domain-containing protein [Clostridia bacterium]